MYPDGPQSWWGKFQDTHLRTDNEGMSCCHVVSNSKCKFTEWAFINCNLTWSSSVNFTNSSRAMHVISQNESILIFSMSYIILLSIEKSGKLIIRSVSFLFSVDYVSAPFQHDLLHIYKNSTKPDTFFRPALRCLLVLISSFSHAAR